MVQKSHRLVLINDREVDSDTARYRPTLISDELRLAKQKFGHALCLCRTPPLKLIIRERGGTVHLACWPDESYLHSSDCAFYTEHYSGARSEGLVVDGENKTHATYHQPWIADSDGSKTKQGESVKLWALLHHLWESSRLYCWVPGWQRNWAIAQRVLTRAAKRTVVNGESLADHIYIPAPFAHSRKEEIQVEWSQFVDPIRSMHRGQGKRATGFILGEVRSLKPVGQGFLLCLKHHGPGVHITQLNTEKGALFIGPGANLKGIVKCGAVQIHGGMDATMDATKVVIKKTAKTRGSIRYSELEICKGGDNKVALLHRAESK